MNKEDFSTTYVPLQPPYQIIKYGKDIGMQIGTMIASRHIEGDSDDAFHIETHSYPVVTYTNKNSVRGNRILFHYSFMEGVVWNKVELRDVSTICLSNSTLDWEGFIAYLWKDFLRQGSKPSFDIESAKRLVELGVKVLPPKGSIKLNLKMFKNKHSNEESIISSPSDKLAINIPWNDDLNKMKMDVLTHILLYQMAVIAITNDINANSKWAIGYETEDERLVPFVNLLRKLKTRDYDFISILTSTILEGKTENEVNKLLDEMILAKATEGFS
ncbi:MAG: hypothetical protein J6N98_05260 [Prevotella sp.]|nr:hypothetical protein [Prevotella sp.]